MSSIQERICMFTRRVKRETIRAKGWFVGSRDRDVREKVEGLNGAEKND